MGEIGIVNDCRECLAGHPHCHGTLIHHGGRHGGRHGGQHWGQQSQCTDPDCTQPEVLLHSLSVDCDVIGCDCGEGTGHQLAV